MIFEGSEGSAVIRHRKWKDVAFKVDMALCEFGRYDIWGQWINLGFEKSWVIYDDVKITVMSEELGRGDFLYCCDPEAKCLRYEQWIEIGKRT